MSCAGDNINVYDVLLLSLFMTMFHSCGASGPPPKKNGQKLAIYMAYILPIYRIYIYGLLLVLAAASNPQPYYPSEPGS